MESLIETFGVDIRLIIIQVINFTVLAVVLTYLLYKPVLKILKEREEKIKQGLSDAEAAAKAKENAEEDRKGIVKAAHVEAGAISQRSEEFAKAKAEEIKVTAEKEAANKLKLAETRSAALLEEAERKSEQEIAKIAVLAAEKVLNTKNS